MWLKDERYLTLELDFDGKIKDRDLGILFDKDRVNMDFVIGYAENVKVLRGITRLAPADGTRSGGADGTTSPGAIGGEG